MILQVHDELNFQRSEAEKEFVQQIVIEEMERAYRMRTPESRLWVGEELVGSPLIPPITLFNLQSESN